MKKICFRSTEQYQSIRPGKPVTMLLLIGIGVAAAMATPSVGFVLNQILAKATTFDNISEHVQIAKNPDGSVDPWQVQLQAQGRTDSYMQHLVLSPGGYSGWHTHPGILVGSVASGSIDFYDAKCQKHSFSAGQVFFENDDVHAIINRGADSADLYIAYLIKHNAPRRIEADAPGCAVSTGIP
jgi:quercetin dioxygenase-like cupin family protein